MSDKYFIRLILITITTLLLAYISYLIQPKFETGINKGEIIFKNLSNNLNNVTEIHIDNGLSKITINKSSDGWVMKSKDNYKVNDEIVRESLIKISQLRFLEQKTQEEFLYSRLDLHYPKDEEGNSKLISIFKENDEKVSEFVLGKRKNKGVYLKEKDSMQTWLTSGDLEISSDEIQWLETKIFNIDYEKIKKINLDHTDGTVVKIKKDDKNENFVIQNLPEGETPKSDLISNFLGYFLSKLDFNDVGIRIQNGNNEYLSKFSFELFDKTIINGVVFKFNEEKWINFSVEEEDISNMVNDGYILVDNINNWSYKLPSTKYNIVETKLVDLLVED